MADESFDMQSEMDGELSTGDLAGGGVRYLAEAMGMPTDAEGIDVAISGIPGYSLAEGVSGGRLSEMLEGIALDRVRNPDKNRGSDVLLLGLLNANLPSKYRPQFAMSEDSAKDLILEWRKAVKEVKQDEPKDAPKDAPASLPEPLQAEVFEILMRKKEDAPQEMEEREK